MDFRIFFVVGNKCGTDIKISPGMDKQFKLFFMNFVIVSVFLFLRFNVKCNGYWKNKNSLPLIYKCFVSPR